MLVKNCQFKPTHLYLVPPMEFCQDFWHNRTRVPGVVRRCLHDPTVSRFGTVSACDGRTHDDSIYRTSIALHGKNETTRLND